jgi:hypothetical protein
MKKVKFLNFKDTSINSIKKKINNEKNILTPDKKSKYLNKNKNNKSNNIQPKNNINNEINNEINDKKKDVEKIKIRNYNNDFNKKIYLKNLSNDNKTRQEMILNSKINRPKKSYDNIPKNIGDIISNPQESKNTNEKKQIKYEIIINRNDKNEYKRGNQTPLIHKTFIEDYNLNDNNSNDNNLNDNNLLTLSYNYSYTKLSLYNKEPEKQIKSNIKNKKINNKEILPSIKEVDEKFKIGNSINKIIKLNTINGMKILEKVIKKKYINIINEKLKVSLPYNDQTEYNNNTLKTSLSNISIIKYKKKIIPSNSIISKDNNNESNKNNLKIKKNFFDVKKQKIILLKRRKEKPFEKYEHCKNFIDNFRLKIIKYILNKIYKSS